MSRIYSIGQLAKRVGKSVSTLRRWDTSGEFLAKKHNSGHRYYDESDVKQLLGIKPEEKKVIVYCRVESTNQKYDLQSQIKAMEQF
ncbi:MAG: IS607 family transposase, partial [Candidatus Parabeggiatoa sp. nov. 1]